MDQRELIDGVVNRQRTDRWPPLSSVREAFQTLPSRILTSSPSVMSLPSGGSSFAKLPGRSSPKIDPKSLSEGNR